MDRKQTEQVSNSGRPPTGADYDALTPKHITGGVHFTAGSGREEGDYDDYRNASEVTSGCNYGEPTAGCSQVDENKSAGKLGEVFSSQAILEVTVNVENVKDPSYTDEESMEDQKASKQTNHLPSGDVKFTILLCKKAGIWDWHSAL